jgi:transcription elongation factor GreA
MTSGPVQYLTPDGRRKLQDELNELVTVRRKEIADDLRRAIQEGDLSENFGYAETRRQQSRVEGRIRELQALLDNAETLDAPSGAHVTLGHTVWLREPGEPDDHFQIVGPAEANPREHRISHESPLGRALLGKRPGDRVQVETPGGAVTFEIVRVE